MRKLKEIYNFLCKIEMVICGIGFVLLVALILLSAILRFFRVSMAWNIDLAMLLLAWTAFLGADVAYRAGQLLGIDLFTRRLPAKAQKTIQILIFVIILGALCVIGGYGLRLAQFEWQRTFQSLPVPYSVVTLSLVFAAFSMAVSTVIKIKNSILNFGKPMKHAEPAGLT